MRKKESFFSREPRRAVIVAWAIGLPVSTCLLILGILGDGEGFWTSRPYFTNVLTALTGAGIGVPFALSVLNGYARIQANATEWSSVQNYANQLVSSLELAINAAIRIDVKDFDWNDSMVKLQYVQARVKELEEHARRDEFRRPMFGLGSATALDSERFHEQYGGVARELAADVYKLEQDVVQCLPNDDEATNISVQFNLDWRTLDTSVRPRIAETKGSWIPLDVYKVLTFRTHDFTSANYVLRGLSHLRTALESDRPSTPFGSFESYETVSSSAYIAPPTLSDIIERLRRVLELRDAVTALRSAIDDLS